MKDVERPLKDLVKGAGVYLTGLVISKFFNYFYRLMVARTGSEQYGILSLGLSFITFLAIFATLGLNNGVLRYVAYYKGREDFSRLRATLLFAFKVTLSLGLLFGFLFFVFSGWVSSTFFPHIDAVKLGLIFKLVALAVPLYTLNFVIYAAFEAFQKLKYEVYSRNIIETGCKLLFSAVLIYWGVGVVGLAAAYVVSVVIGFVFALYFLEGKVYHFLKSKVAPIYSNKELMSYSWPLMLSSFFITILGSIDTWMLGYFRNASDVGVYNAAYPTAQLLLTIPYIFLALFLPILTELYAKGESSSFNSVYHITVKWIAMAVLLPLILMFLFSRVLLGILFGPEYSAGYFALLVLTAGFFVHALALASQNILMVFNRTKTIFLNYVVVTVFALILNTILIPRYSFNGAAIATASSYVLLSILLFFESYRHVGFRFFKFDYFKILLGGILVTLLAFAALKLFVASISIYIIVAFSLAASVIYFLFLLVTKAFSKEDIMIIDAVQKRFGYNILGRIKFLRRFLEP